MGSIDAHPILVDHATGTQRKVVDYLDAGEQRETEKKTGNASKGYQQIHPTEEHLTLVAYNGPGEELHQHSRHISAIHAEVMKDTYITDIAPNLWYTETNCHLHLHQLVDIEDRLGAAELAL